MAVAQLPRCGNVDGRSRDRVYLVSGSQFKCCRQKYMVCFDQCFHLVSVMLGYLVFKMCSCKNLVKTGRGKKALLILLHWPNVEQIYKSQISEKLPWLLIQYSEHVLLKWRLLVPE